VKHKRVPGEEFISLEEKEENAKRTAGTESVADGTSCGEGKGGKGW